MDHSSIPHLQPQITNVQILPEHIKVILTRYETTK